MNPMAVPAENFVRVATTGLTCFIDWRVGTYDLPPLPAISTPAPPRSRGSGGLLSCLYTPVVDRCWTIVGRVARGARACWAARRSRSIVRRLTGRSWSALLRRGVQRFGVFDLHSRGGFGLLDGLIDGVAH